MEKQWYYAKNGVPHGLFTFRELKAKFNSGEFGRDDLVFQVGMTEWIPAHKVSDLLPSRAIPPPLPQARRSIAEPLNFTHNLSPDELDCVVDYHRLRIDPPHSRQVDFLMRNGFCDRCARCGSIPHKAEVTQIERVFLRRPFSLVGSFVFGYLPANVIVYLFYLANGIGGLIPAWIGIAICLSVGGGLFRVWNAGMPRQPVKLTFCRLCRRNANHFLALLAICCPCFSWIFPIGFGYAVDKSWRWRWRIRIHILQKARGLVRLEFRNASVAR